MKYVEIFALTLAAVLALPLGTARAQQAIRVNRPQPTGKAGAKAGSPAQPAPGQPWVAVAPTPGGFYDDHTGKPAFYEPLTGEAFVPPAPPGQLPFSSHLGVSVDVRKIANSLHGASAFEGAFYSELALHWASEVFGGFVGLIPDSGNALTFGLEVGPYYGAELGSPAKGVTIAFLGPGAATELIKFDDEDAPLAFRLAILGLGLGVTSSGDTGPPLYFLVRCGNPALQMNPDAGFIELGYVTLESGIAFF